MKKKVDTFGLVMSLSLIARTGWWRLLATTERLITSFCHKYGVPELEKALEVVLNRGGVESFVSYMTDATIPDTLRLNYRSHEIEWTWD